MLNRRGPDVLALSGNRAAYRMVVELNLLEFRVFVDI